MCEKAWCDATSYDPRYPQGLQLAITRVERDEKAIAELEAACIEANEEVNAMVSELQQMRGAAWFDQMQHAVCWSLTPELTRERSESR